MKKLIVLSILLLTLSCSKEENLCECTENIYETQVFNNGLNIVLVSEEPVECQDEVLNFIEISPGVYYKIKCN